jgi:phosphatidylglycerophosphate synthase
MLELEGSLKKKSGAWIWILANLTVPNIISLTGFYLTFKLIYLNYIGVTGIYAFYHLVGAAITDFLDGFIAKHFHCETKLGSILDKSRDKLLIVTTFFFARGTYKSSSETIAQYIYWELNLIICLEIGLSVVAGLIAVAGGCVRANNYGRFKMGFECATAILWAILYYGLCVSIGLGVSDTYMLQLMLFLSTMSLFLASMSTYHQIMDNYKLAPRLAQTIRTYYNWH